MHELRCPHCGQVFTVDESGYAALVQQVRDSELSREIDRRSREIKAAGEKEREIERMRQQAALTALENEKAQALAALEQEKAQALAAKESEIERLSAELKSGETRRQLAVAQAEHAKDIELVELKASLATRDQEAELKEKNLREQYEIELRLKDEEIERMRDFRSRQSTKMVGESLEQHCLDEFNKIRMTAFPEAYFEKDNDASSGSKGDFIYREELDGVELLSIMFEMKNEMETTATKHKNEDFLRELDKDRREKGCEYAVLVSLLEADSELYNAGIVDVSYRYPRMYVVRPQCFIPIITLLRNAALRSHAERRELMIVRSQEVDLTHFEANIADFKSAFNYNYEQAGKRFDEAIREIDRSIKALQDAKDKLTRTDNQLRLASQKIDEQLSVKRLTRDAPTIRAKLEELRGE